MMNQPPMTCELVDQRELDRRYVAGQLNEDEAAAFEAHYFGCDRCWSLVKGGADVRAAFAASGVAPAARPRTWWKPLAIAAGLGLVALGVWRVAGPGVTADRDAIRGDRDSLAVHSELSVGLWRANWPSVLGAASYRVRVFTGDGQLLLTRESADTTVTLSADSLATLGRGGTLYLEVQGFDRLLRPVARSPLVALLPPGTAR